MDVVDLAWDRGERGLTVFWRFLEEEKKRQQRVPFENDKQGMAAARVSPAQWTVKLSIASVEMMIQGWSLKNGNCKSNSDCNSRSLPDDKQEKQRQLQSSVG